MENQIVGQKIIAYFDCSLFSKDAILKCLYWYGDKFHISISNYNDDFYIVTLASLPSVIVQEEELEIYLQKLERDVIDFQLRDSITKETKNIRDLLLAKAFSNGEFDEEPSGEITDPVGFNPYS